MHGFEVGMKLEVIHPLRPYTLCAATVTKSLGPYYFAVTTDFIPDIPTFTFCCHSDSPGIFPPAWSLRNGVEFTFPASMFLFFYVIKLFKISLMTMVKAKSFSESG